MDCPSRTLSIGTIVVLSLIGVSLATGCNQEKTSSSAQNGPTAQANQSPSGIPGKTTFQRIITDSRVRVGYVLADPWVIRNPQTGELSGTFVDTFREIAKQMGVEVEFVEATFATFAAGLQTGKYDVSIAPTFATIQRAKSVCFTVPLGALGSSAIVKAEDNRFTSLADMDKKGIVIAVTQGEQGHEYAKTNFTNAEIRVLSGGDQNLTFAEVLAGRADVALGDAWFTSQFAKRQSKVRDLFADQPYNVIPAAWSVRYDDVDLLLFLNTSLDALETSGRLSEIDKKYGAKWLRPKKIWVKS